MAEEGREGVDRNNQIKAFEKDSTNDRDMRPIGHEEEEEGEEK